MDTVKNVVLCVLLILTGCGADSVESTTSELSSSAVSQVRIDRVSDCNFASGTDVFSTFSSVCLDNPWVEVRTVPFAVIHTAALAEERFFWGLIASSDNLTIGGEAVVESERQGNVVGVVFDAELKEVVVTVDGEAYRCEFDNRTRSYLDEICSSL